MTMRFLLVHSPFLGPASWAPVATELRGRGFDVAVPDIRGWTSWQDQIRVIEERDVDVIVAHSGAGPLVPAIASHLRGDAASVFVDAALPHPGSTRFDALPPDFVDLARSLAVDDHLPPWPTWFDATVGEVLIPDAALRRTVFGEAVAVAVVLFEEVMPTVPDWRTRPAAFIETSGAYADESSRAAAGGWETAAFDGTHLSIVTDPAEIADVVIGILGSI